MIPTYVVLAMLILGWSVVQDAHSEEAPPTQEVVKIYDSLVSLPVDPEAFKEYLRHPSFYEEIPEAIIVDVVCYSDGNGRISVLSGWRDFIRTLTDDGKFLINEYMVGLGNYACSQAMEVWNATDIIDESKPVWYL